jgi:glycosyltransferase involved in cell wall biosynthesis
MSNYSDWESGVVNRNFFVTQQLLQQPEFEQVLFIDFLAQQPLKKLFGRKRALHYLLKARGLRKVSEKLHVYEKLNISKTEEQVVQHINKLMKKLGFTPGETVLWSYNAFLPQVYDLEVKTKVFDAVDNWSHHASYKQKAKKLEQNYQLIDKKADLIFTVSEGLKDLFTNKQVHWVPNGIDLEKFKQVSQAKLEYKKPIIGYVGTIQERLDFDLIEQVLKDHQQKSFVFIGPVWKGVEKKVDALKKAYSNIHFLGRRAYTEIPAYLAAMDVTIIPHRIDDFINSTNPMKMYDYLAAGKPVVTTPGAGTEDFSEVLSIQESAEAFSKAIERELVQDSQDKQQKRKQTVEAHQWSERVNRMMKYLLQ